MFLKTHRYEQAVQAWQELIGTPFDHPEIYQGRGAALRLLGRMDEAKRMLQECVRRSPANAGVWNDLGYLHAREGEYEEAHRCVRASLEVSREDGHAWVTLGYTHMMSGQFAPAIEALLKAIELLPDNTEAWRVLVHAYRRAGRDDKERGALEYLRTLRAAEADRTEEELRAGTIP